MTGPESIKAPLLRTALVLAVPAGLLMAHLDLRAGHLRTGLAEGAFTVMAALLAWRFEAPRGDVWRRRAGILALCGIYTLYGFDQATAVSHLLWLPLFPVIVLLLTDPAEAGLWILLMVAGQLAAYLGFRYEQGVWPVPPILLLETSIVFTAVTTLTFAYDRGSHTRIGRLYSLASTDPLTGLVNRRAFFERALEEQARGLRFGRTWSILMLDIDHFKRVNDTLGHAEGDRVLEVFARQLEAHVRQTDIPARIGGEEFAILAVGSDLDGAADLAGRLRAAIKQVDWGRAGEITCSIGVAETREAEPMPAVLDRADRAMYMAKTQGRDRVVLAS